MTSCTGRISANTRPHQSRWGDQEMGIAISCTECSQVAGLIQKAVETPQKHCLFVQLSFVQGLYIACIYLKNYIYKRSVSQICIFEMIALDILVCTYVRLKHRVSQTSWVILWHLKATLNNPQWLWFASPHERPSSRYWIAKLTSTHT